VFIAWAMCGLMNVTVAALCSTCSLLCISNSDWATENEAGRSVSVNGNEEPRWWELSPVQFSCNCNYSLITHNKTPVHSTWGLLRVWPARLPVLTWVPSSVPPGTTSKICFPLGPCRIHQNLAGSFMSSFFKYNKQQRGSCLRFVAILHLGLYSNNSYYIHYQPDLKCIFIQTQDDISLWMLFFHILNTRLLLQLKLGRCCPSWHHYNRMISAVMLWSSYVCDWEQYSILY